MFKMGKIKRKLKKKITFLLLAQVQRLHQTNKKNYIILREYIKCILLLFTEVVGSIMNLINRIHDFCERREYAFNVLSKYSIITRKIIKSHK